MELSISIGCKVIIAFPFSYVLFVYRQSPCGIDKGFDGSVYVGECCNWVIPLTHLYVIEYFVLLNIFFIIVQDPRIEDLSKKITAVLFQTYHSGRIPKQ